MTSHYWRYSLRITFLALLSLATVRAYPASDALARLYADAAREGHVSIWASNAEDVLWIPEQFNKEYPGISVSIFTDTNVAARLITEARANHYEADVIWNSEALLSPLSERNLLSTPNWTALGVSPHDVGLGGKMVYTNSTAFVVAYNTTTVKAADVPQSWQDIQSPQYSGQMAASSFLLARLFAALAAGDSNKPSVVSLARKVRTTSNMLWSNDLLEQIFTSGERKYIVGTAYYLVDRWKAKGLPVDYVFPEPVPLLQFGTAVLVKAPHPASAQLLAAWLSGPKGKAARQAILFAVDLRPDSTNPLAARLRASGKRLIHDSEERRAARNALIPEMDRVLNGLD